MIAEKPKNKSEETWCEMAVNFDDEISVSYFAGVYIIL
jgi:hypothetical protein